MLAFFDKFKEEHHEELEQISEIAWDVFNSLLIKEIFDHIIIITFITGAVIQKKSMENEILNNLYGGKLP